MGGGTQASGNFVQSHCGPFLRAYDDLPCSMTLVDQERSAAAGGAVAGGVAGADHRAVALTLIRSARIDELTDELVAQLARAEPGYREFDALTPEQLRSSVRDNLSALLVALGDRAAIDLDVPRASGRLKALQGVPLEAMLHAYRLGGRLIWGALVALADDADRVTALLDLATDVWEIVDEFSGAAAGAYRETILERERSTARSRSLLLLTLLDGTVTSTSRAGEVLQQLGLSVRGPFAVVSAQIGENGEEPLPDVEKRLRGIGVESAWAQQGRRQLGLLAAPPCGTFDTALPVVAGLTQARVGVSRPFTSLVGADGARAEAELAQRCVEGDRGTPRVRRLTRGAPRGCGRRRGGRPAGRDAGSGDLVARQGERGPPGHPRGLVRRRRVDDAPPR